MITDDELKQMFPNDALMIPLSNAPSAEVVVGGGQYEPDPDESAIFFVWVSPYRELRVSRDVTLRDGGLEADSGIGKIFLRPLEARNA